MKDNFEKAVQFILRWEGEYSDDPLDPGGKTIFGIASKYHPEAVKQMDDLWKQGNKQGALNIAKPIYRKKYWDACNCDDLSSGIDITIFDTAVNLGVNKAKEFLNLSKSVEDILFKRIDYYCEVVGKYPLRLKFLRGWINRVIGLRQFIA